MSRSLLNFKESFFNYLNLVEKVADAFRRPSVLIESTVSATENGDKLAETIA